MSGVDGKIDRCPDCGKVISLRFPVHDCRPKLKGKPVPFAHPVLGTKLHVWVFEDARVGVPMTRQAHMVVDWRVARVIANTILRAAEHAERHEALIRKENQQRAPAGAARAKGGGKEKRTAATTTTTATKPDSQSNRGTKRKGGR